MKRDRNWWDYKITTLIVAGILLALMAIAMASPIILWAYLQRYIVDDNNTTATKGVMFENTIYLKEYKNLGHGNGWFGEYERYSRSDRHTDVLSIYKD